VLDLLRSAVDVDGQTAVMVTHDARAAALADRRARIASRIR
jgi:ABC-type lipoprotein export system ATPase subunit